MQKKSNNPSSAQSLMHLLSCQSCCLGKIQIQENEQINQLRTVYSNPEITLVHGDMPNFKITPDMVVSDILRTFPQTKSFFADEHPLGLLSPNLDQQSIELFFAGLPVDPEAFCQTLNKIISTK